MAQKAELRGKINLDSSGFKRGIQQSKRSVGTFVSTLKGSLLPALGAAGAAGALIGLGRSAINTASEIKDLAQLSGLGVEDFQKYAEAAKTVNIEQEKLADIFKDTSDKIGDFLQTGGGAMADFFENIAPKVGATREEFVGLSGADALQLYVKYLEDANLPHEQMVFYMEAIASDASRLIPLLQDGGEAFRTLGQGAEEAGRIMSEETINALDRAEEALDRFKTKATIITGNVIGVVMGIRQPMEELAIAQLRAEGAFEGLKGGGGTVRRAKLIQQRVKLLEEETKEKEKQAEIDRQAAIEAAKEVAAEKARKDADEKAEKEKRDNARKEAIKERERKKLEREKEQAERKKLKDAETKLREDEAALEEALDERIAERKLALLKAEAAEESALIHEKRKELELEERIQSIMASTNLGREQAVKLAQDLIKASAGADVNQSGYVTPREQRAFERKKRKEEREQRRRERAERAAEVAADERKREEERNKRMEEREKAAGFGAGAEKAKEPKGAAAEQKQEQEIVKMEENIKKSADTLEKIEQAIKENP